MLQAVGNMWSDHQVNLEAVLHSTYRVTLPFPVNANYKKAVWYSGRTSVATKCCLLHVTEEGLSETERQQQGVQSLLCSVFMAAGDSVSNLVMPNAQIF